MKVKETEWMEVTAWVGGDRMDGGEQKGEGPGERGGEKMGEIMGLEGRRGTHVR